MWRVKHGEGPVAPLDLIRQPAGSWCIYSRFANTNKLQTMMQAYASQRGARVSVTNLTGIDRYGDSHHLIKVTVTQQQQEI